MSIKHMNEVWDISREEWILPGRGMESLTRERPLCWAQEAVTGRSGSRVLEEKHQPEQAERHKRDGDS